LVNQHNFIRPIRELLKDEKRLMKMGRQSREHALKHTGKNACRKAIEEMFRHLGARPDSPGLTAAS
jgi:hypothetical protein